MGYINEGNGPVLFWINVAAIIIVTIFSGLRMYVRYFMVKLWKLEDWLFTSAYVLFVIFCVMSLMAAVYGNGQRLTSISLPDLPLAMEYWFVCELFYVPLTMCIRLSIGVFLLRVASTQKPYIFTIYGMFGLITVQSIVGFFFSIFQCKPVSYFWLQFSLFPGKCLPAVVVQDVAIALAVCSAIIDMTLGILPIFLIWNLKMNPRTKAAAMVLLSLGTIAGITVIVRIYYIRQVSLVEDFLYATTKVSIWATVEPSVGIICAAAATYRPLFKSLQERSTRNYFTPGTSDLVSGGKNNSAFQQKRSMRSANRAGYLKSGSGYEDSNDDEIPLDRMERGLDNDIRSPSDTSLEGREMGKGIYMSKTVEVSSSERRREKDMV